MISPIWPSEHWPMWWRPKVKRFIISNSDSLSKALGTIPWIVTVRIKWIFPEISIDSRVMIWIRWIGSESQFLRYVINLIRICVEKRDSCWHARLKLSTQSKIRAIRNLELGNTIGSPCLERKKFQIQGLNPFWGWEKLERT